MKKILVLFCGGTIIMNKNANGQLIPPINENEAIETIKSLEPRISELAKIEISYLRNVDSTNIKPPLWNDISSRIARQYHDFDGFVITHGTDSMAYSSSALSFTLKNLGKPVVLTGSQIPGSELDTDARRNFVNAVKLATWDISGVYIVFDERIILGCRATKVSESSLDAYRTVNKNDIGQIKTDFEFLRRVEPRDNSIELEIKPGFQSDIAVITLAPGNDPDDLAEWIDFKRVKGMIIQGFGSGNIPDNYEDVFKKAFGVIPIVVMSQCLNGRTNLDMYAVGSGATKYNVIQSYDMSLETTTTKLMWALDHLKYDDIKEFMEENIAGELDRQYL